MATGVTPDGGTSAPAPAPVSTPPDPASPVTPAAPGSPVHSPPSGDPALDPKTPGTPPAPPAEPAAPAEPTDPPPPFDLKLPEGFRADEAFEKFKVLAQKQGLKPEAAQAVVDLYADAQKASIARQFEAEAQTHKAWAEASKADREFGGAKFDANLQVAQRAVAKFGTPELRGLLDSTRLGDHPEVIRLFHKLGRAMSEDSVAGTSTNGVASSANSIDAVLRASYPTMYPKD